MQTPIYKIETFEGPLDLLLTLIQKNKMDICDIQITVIFRQYMEYIDTMREMNMEIAGEFIVMATELMFIKSRMLLPKTEPEEEDPRERLAQALLEYKRAKEAAKYFEEQFSTYGRRMSKDTDEIPPDTKHLSRQDLKLLEQALARLLVRREAKEKEPLSNIAPIIHRVIVPVSQTVRAVVELLHNEGRTRFENLFSVSASKSEAVALFLAVLSLIKEGHMELDKEYILNHDGETDDCEAVFYCSLTDENFRPDDEFLKEFDQ